MQIKTEGDKYDKNFGKNIKGFVKESVLTPFFMILEVIVETIIPFLMSSMIDDGINKGDMQHIFITGGYMGALALTGLFAGMMGGIYGAKASAGFARTSDAQCLQISSHSRLPTLTVTQPQDLLPV